MVDSVGKIDYWRIDWSIFDGILEWTKYRYLLNSILYDLITDINFGKFDRLNFSRLGLISSNHYFSRKP